MSFLTKNWYYIIPVVFLLSPLFIILYISGSYGYNFPESIAVMQHLGEADTKFQVPTYREKLFKRIQPGMMGREVFELIGMPLERHDNDTRWLYSVPVGGAVYYHERALKLEKGRVTEVINRFHLPE